MIAAHDVRMNIAAGQDRIGVGGRDEDVVEASPVVVLAAIRSENCSFGHWWIKGSHEMSKVKNNSKSKLPI